MSFNYGFTWEYYPLSSSPVITASDSTSGNIDVTVYPTWYSSVNVSWTYPSTWGAVRTNVYHSAKEQGPFTKLTLTPLDTNVNSLSDVTTQDFSKIYEGWYVVEGVLSSGKRIQSSPTSWRNKRNSWVQLRASEIQRREWLLLRNFVGVESYVFSRKTYGQRCEECWDYNLEKIVRDRCSVCYGTSFQGGYWAPVKTLMQYDSTPDEILLQYFGKFENNMLTAWTISYPHIEHRDLLYRKGDGKLFEVGKKADTELQAVALRQIMQLTELDKESPEFKIVVDYAI
jgi:hypothetical protein